MFKIFLCFVNLFFILPIYCKEKIKVIITADKGYQPYSFENNGKPDGLYYIILKKIFDQMTDYDIKVQAVPWKRAINDVEKGLAFAVYPPYKNKKERPFLDYSYKIMNESLSLFCRSDSPYAKKTQWPKDFHGARIAINSGFIFGNINNTMKKSNIHVDSGAISTLQNLQKLENGRCDCYINDELAIEVELKKGKYNKRLPKNKKIIKTIDIEIMEAFLAYNNNDPKFIYRKAFITQFNNILKNMDKNNAIENIKKKYISN